MRGDRSLVAQLLYVHVPRRRRSFLCPLLDAPQVVVGQTESKPRQPPPVSILSFFDIILNYCSWFRYVFDDEMTTWSGYAFEAIDGTLQGVPFVLYQFVVPVPKFLTVAAGASVGIWTLYIHVAEPALPWPFMGADYHSVHHIYNWFNFGLFTVLWDYMHNTLRHPDEATAKFAHATKQKRKDLKELHQMWSKPKST
mmetsp:Transcript_10568/g.20272  ORF Transcript_10568/g.20272 Transcript_10568/m.20272 type:complete len:197 (-) Transcript_10568:538-1128(-)